ncbi:MAG: phenylalanine--tRNA ligase subunit alpha [Pseudomonadota bacterium]|nr:phenylalanine--tRNA ligase subunit alpha [Pseudomonadota bacterium]
MKKKFSSLITQLKDELEKCDSLNSLIQLKSNYLGKKGLITLEFNQIKELSGEEKKLIGKELNAIKLEANELINKKDLLIKNLTSKKGKKYFFDVTLPGKNIEIGSRHPITITIELIEEILSSFGFMSVTGPEIESEFFNFEALNIPKNHPARDLHDTFYINEERLLRTHTSSVQIHTMLKTKPPVRIMTPGKVYRCDSDPTHSPMFHQVEGLYVDKDINFCHLRGLLTNFLRKFFDDKKIQIRFRPSYFPFTEPSAEIDIQFKGKWLEVLGCGMVHPNVLKNVKIDPKNYSGFAFGLGVERLAMLKFGISDLKVFFDNDLMFLSQFSNLK